MTNVLVINSGSSSLKYQVVDADTGVAAAIGLIERIGLADGMGTHTVDGRKHTVALDVPDHEAAMAAMVAAFDDDGPELSRAGLVAVGHRVVQGGAKFASSVVITDEVVAAIEDVSDLAPLHNPANLQGITVARQLFPQLPQVAVFDTAFHLTMPPVASTYALDRELAQQYRIRRYGAHGTSHQYASRVAAEFLGIDKANLIVLHLGNGASATAVRGGISVDTSMGLTPLEGLVMGTRTGDIDPAVTFHLADSAGLSIAEISDVLNRRSGMLGLTGMSDMRDVETAAAQGDPAAVLALDIYCYRLRKYLGSYTAVLGRVDAVVFTAGIGENSATVRAGALADLDVLGLVIDDQANQVGGQGIRDITGAGSRSRILIVPTNEEWEIARESVAVVTAEN